MNGKTIASTFSWNLSMQSMILLPNYTILHFYGALPHLGFTNTIVKYDYKM